MPTPIPERAPLGDPFSGILARVATIDVLSVDTLPGVETLASGAMIVRYGVPFLGKMQLAIVPGLVVLDYGDILTGEDAWDFLLKHSHLHPRAEVVGYRSDGVDDMVFIRSLDLARPVVPLAYADAAAMLPLGRPEALIAADTTGLAPRLRAYLPVFPSLAAWQAERAHER